MSSLQAQLKEQLAGQITSHISSETGVPESGVTLGGVPVVNGELETQNEEVIAESDDVVEESKTDTQSKSESDTDQFVCPNGDEHTKVATEVAKVIIGRKPRTIDLPTGESAVQFAVWAHLEDGRKVAINFFGYRQFSMLNQRGAEVNAKVEIWEKKVRSGHVYRYINFYPTTDDEVAKLHFGPSESDSVLVRFAKLK